MIKKLQSLSETVKTINKKDHNSSNINNQNKQQEPKLIDNKTITQFRQQLRSIQQKIINLKTKRYCFKQHQWGNLKQDINQILGCLKLNRLRKVFQRKFQQQIRLLNDFYTKKYQQSIFRFCFFCCPSGILRQLKYYKFIDQIFQYSMSHTHKTQRNIYFYLNLLYIQLFLMLISCDNALTIQFNKKMIQSVEVQAKQQKIIQKRKIQVGQLQLINDVFVMQQDNFKNLKPNQKFQSSYIIQSDNLKQINRKVQPRQPLNKKLIHPNYFDDIKKVQSEIHTIISNDWKDIISTQEWAFHSYYGYIQINSQPPIQTSLQFKDCKLKTNYLFGDISSSSFDLRTYLVRKSKSKNYQYVLDALHQDSVHFELRFWLSDSQRTQQNHQNIQKFLLLTMRVGIKEKISKMCNSQYRFKMGNWMIRNYVHLNIPEPAKNQSNVQIDMQGNQKSSFMSIPQQNETKPSQKYFWWVNLGSQLINAIVQVAKQKMQKQKKSPISMKALNKKISKMSTDYDNNPQTNQRLVKKSSSINYHSAKQI